MNRREVPLTGCDCFHLALDGMMRQAGQGPNVALAVVELATPVPSDALQRAVNGLAATFPIVDARIGRRSPVGIPFWRLPRDPRPPRVLFWHEHGARLAAASGDYRVQIPDAADLIRRRLATGPPGDANLALDAVARRDGTGMLVVTWRHALLDAKGGELLVTALDALGRDPALDPAFSMTAPERLASRNEALRSRLEGMHAVGVRLDALREPAFRSLGGPDARPSAPCFRVLTLSDGDARVALDRAEEHSGAFARMAFFLAAAARAHHAIFRERNADPGAYVVSIPVQIQRKGASGPVFQNHLSILFFGVPCADVADLGSLTRSIRGQLTEMMRDRLDQRWADGLRLARRVPSPLLMRMMRRRFRGEIASFFHSFTGPFANDVASFLGSRVVNAYHVPTVSQPPGTGLFVGMHGNQLNVTLSWRRDALSDEEAGVLLDSVRSDLVGIARARTRRSSAAVGAS